jgi:hypothetical protein
MYCSVPCLFLISPLVRSCFDCCLERGREEKSGVVAGSLIQIAMFVYGGIVLIGKDPCPQCRDTGIYKMAYVWYFLDMCILGFGICVAMIALFCSGDDD